MDLGLRDSVAVVVGGASGIGRAIAAAFADEGATAAVIDLREANGLPSFVADVTDYAAVQPRLCGDSHAVWPCGSRRLRGRRSAPGSSASRSGSSNRRTGIACCA